MLLHINGSRGVGARACKTTQSTRLAGFGSARKGDIGSSSNHKVSEMLSQCIAKIHGHPLVPGSYRVQAVYEEARSPL